MHMLKVDIQSVPPAVSLLCSGRIVLGVEAETLRCIVTSRPERRVVLDLRGVTVLDAAGLGLLVELHCWAQERSNTLTIANTTPRVRRLIALTNLHSVLSVSHCGVAVGSVQQQQDDKNDRSGPRAMTA